jgi:hypothetical protein
MNVHFYDLATIDQVPALDHVKLWCVWRFESVHKRLVIESNGVNDERIAFVMADRVAVPGRLKVLGMFVGEIDRRTSLKLVRTITASPA